MPLVIITVSIKQGAYSSHEAGYCWLSNEDGVIWAFLAPVFLVLILNTIILVSSAIRIGTARKNLDKMKQMRVALISAFILTPVLGMPWLVSFAKIITVGIENQLVLAILDRFIDWVFICLNAPAGVVFFIIILKRFLENRKSLKKSKSGTSNVATSTSGVDLSKFKKPVKSTVSNQSLEQISITGLRICKSNSNASGISSVGVSRNRKEPLSNRESLLDCETQFSIYSTLDTNLMETHKKCPSSSRQSSKLTSSVYEVASMEDLSKTPSSLAGDIPLEVIRERRLSISCQLPIDDQFASVDEHVKLTGSDDDVDVGTKNPSIFSRGIEFIKNSVRKSKREELADTEANPSPTPSSTNSEYAAKYHNIYMEHLNKLTEKTRSNPEIDVIPSEDTAEATVGIRKKSAPTSSRLSCQHAVKVKDLKEIFDGTKGSGSENQYTSITESDDEDNSDNKVGHSLEQQQRKLTDLEKDGKEKSTTTTQSIDVHNDDVFSAISSFKIELSSNQPRKKKSHDLYAFRKTNSLGNLDNEETLPMQRGSTDALGQHTSSVSQRIRCFEEIIETNTVETSPKRSQSAALSIRVNKDPTTSEHSDSI